MIPLLAALLLTALPTDGGIQAETDPVPAQAAPEAAAPQPSPATPAQLPEATSPQVPGKPALHKQQLKILAQDSRIEAYGEFRKLYEAGQFDEALPYAKRVVELSEANAERDHELPIAYNNLGATQYQLGDYAAAETSYRKSLELLEATQGISSRRLIVPLAGLGATHAARDQHEIAAELFDRALAVSRRADGLFNLQQLPLIEQAANSRYAFSDFAGAERERIYALRVAEQNYGYGDARTLSPLLGLAAFYESLREFIAARMMYLRARDVAIAQNKGYSAPAIKALCGIARTYRMQLMVDPETLSSQESTLDDVMGDMSGMPQREPRVLLPSADRSGLKSAQVALELLRSTPNPPKDLLTETLVELGDWFQATARPAVSMPYYAEAAGIFDAQEAADPLAGNPLKSPRMVFYRPPIASGRRSNMLPGQYVIRKTVFSFLVTEAGVPEGITVVSTDMDEDRLASSRRALQKAIYSPRFADGKPVSTAGVTFTSEWYEGISSKEPPNEASPKSQETSSQQAKEPPPEAPKPVTPETPAPSGG